MLDELLIDMLDNIVEGVYFVDDIGCIHYWNKSAERISGYGLSEVFGCLCSDNILRHVDAAGKELCVEGCPLRAAMTDGRSREAEVFLHHKEGYRVPVSVRAIPYRDASGKICGVIEIFTDRSERNRTLAEFEELKMQSLTDPLTGLGNRRYLDLRLEPLFRALEAEGRSFGFLMLDIDRFKVVNDTYGHQVGDRILKAVSGTMANALRHGDIAVRWGGEEFVAVLPTASAAELEEAAERIRVLVEGSWLELEDGRRISVTVSIGGAMARPGEDAESLAARADRRLYDCKEGGRNRCLVDE